MSDLSLICDLVDSSKGEAKKAAKADLRTALKATPTDTIRDVFEARDGRTASANVIKAHLAKLDQGAVEAVQAEVSPGGVSFGEPSVEPVSGLLDDDTLVAQMLIRAGSEGQRLECKRLYNSIRVALKTRDAILEIRAENGGELPPWNKGRGPERESFDGSIIEVQEKVRPRPERVAPAPAPSRAPADTQMQKILSRKPGAPAGLAVG